MLVAPLQVGDVVSVFDGEIQNEAFLLSNEILTEFYQLPSGSSVDCFQSSVDYSPYSVDCSQSSVDCSQSSVDCSQSSVDCSQSSVDWFLPALARHLFPIDVSLQLVVHLQSGAFFLSLSSFVFSSDNSLFSVSNLFSEI